MPASQHHNRAEANVLSSGILDVCSFQETLTATKYIKELYRDSYFSLCYVSKKILKHHMSKSCFSQQKKDVK